MKAYHKDIARTIRKTKKRFFSIVVITILGVTMFSGLSAACRDLRRAADELYDSRDLYDIRVISTLGLEEADVAAISGIEGVERAEGTYTETVHTRSDEKEQRAEIRVLREGGLAQPQLLEGNLPRQADEIAVTEYFCTETGKKIGDEIRLESEDPDNSCLTRNRFTISAIILDPTDLIASEGAASFRSSGSGDDGLYVAPGAVDSDLYTAVCVTVSGAKELLCYSDDYENRVNAVIDRIETEIQDDREQARYDKVVGEAQKELDDAREEADEELADAEKELNDGQKKLDDAREELADAREELADGRKQLEDGKKELADARKELADGRKEAADGEQELEDGQKKLDSERKKAEQEFRKAEQELEDGEKQQKAGEKKLAESEQQLEDGEKQLKDGKKELAAQKKETYDQIEKGRAGIESGLSQAEAGISQIGQQETKVREAMGEAWPQAAWDSYVNAVRQAYLPVSQLQAQQAAEEEITAAEAAAQRTAGQAEQEFEQTMTSAAAAMSAGLSAAAGGPDPSAPGYEQAMQQLAAQQAQLEGLPAQAALLGQELGKAQASRDALNGQLQALDAGRQEADEQFAAAEKELEEQEARMKSARKELIDGRKQLKEGRKQLEEGRAELEEQKKKAEAEFARAQKELDQGKRDLEDAKEKLAQGERELADGEKEIADNEQKLIDGEKELADGEKEIADSEEELADGWKEYLDAKQDAEEELADAQRDIDDIDMAAWYVQDRNSISSYMTIESDAASIETVGDVFPVLFLTVAILISLTTITRMVEEERGLIGTYKALGFHDSSVYGKYLIYAVAASAVGGIAGNVCGFVFLPMFLFRVFHTMYKLPSYPIRFYAGYGITGMLLFIAGAVGAAFFACRTELSQMPAALMRPRSPKAGSRVFLERIPVIWKRFSFLNKVTVRNLFRYKKRLFMTVGGILGCTALLVVGMAIRDSVSELLPMQYDRIYCYDVMAVAMEEDNDALMEKLQRDERAEDILNIRTENVKVTNPATEKEESVPLLVIPDGQSLEGYIRLESTQGGVADLDDSGLWVTQNLSVVMEFAEGDSLTVRTPDLAQGEAPAAGIVRNYLGNNVYMSQNLYEKLFGEYQPNAALIRLSPDCGDPIAFEEELAEEEEVVSAVSTLSMRNEFAKSFGLIDSVVVLVTVLAAGLAFVVLFTLSTTNISERERELATIKVLGFFDREVHLYVNKETVILTLMGITLGLPTGRFFSGLLTTVLKMPSVYFAVTVKPFSYVFAAGMTLIFALIVNLITNRMLDRIVMVDALKSVE